MIYIRGVKNWLISQITRPMMRPKHFNTGRTLVVSTTGLGDTIWASPALRALQGQYLALLTRDVGKELFKSCPHLDAIYTISNQPIRSMLPMLHRLRRERFDTIYIFHASQRPIFPLCASLGASKIVGTEGLCKGLDWVLTDKVPKRRCHEIERRLDMLGEKAPKDHKLELFLSDEEISEAQTFLANYPKPWVGMQPFAADQFKEWPIHAYSKVAQAMPTPVFVMGSPGQQNKCSQIASSHNLAGKFSLRQLAAIISQLDLFITCDTGPMHIAYACNTPTLAFFSPTHPDLCGPHHAPNARILYEPPTCTPCVTKKCRAPFCMRQISPDTVIESAREMLS
ncbi:MAG: glycosyltransferase family 9 protein [Simkaniaceae bacterium]|nr:glycosyltransferase family 9 protein [Simkaniaceae bacterium]